jgi:hypothetical protein
MAQSKEFDIVVHGATGFTGRLVIEYLLTRTSGLRWAMGGRSASKLAAVREEVGAPADTPLVVIDSQDAASLQALMARTRLVLTTGGPYQCVPANTPFTPSASAAAAQSSNLRHVDLAKILAETASAEPLDGHRLHHLVQLLDDIGKVDRLERSLYHPVLIIILPSPLSLPCQEVECRPQFLLQNGVADGADMTFLQRLYNSTHCHLIVIPENC